MRAFGFISLLLTLGIIAFLMMKQQDPGNGGTDPGTAKATEMAAERAAATASLTVVRTAVDAYHRTQEKWPPTLDAVVEAGFLNRVPGGVQYNAETGDVSLAAPQP
jgi:hypothetical protein